MLLVSLQFRRRETVPLKTLPFETAADRFKIQTPFIFLALYARDTFINTTVIVCLLLWPCRHGNAPGKINQYLDGSGHMVIWTQQFGCCGPRCTLCS